MSEPSRRILLEGPPFDGAEIEWPVAQLGVPARIALSYEAPTDLPEGLPAPGGPTRFFTRVFSYRRKNAQPIGDPPSHYYSSEQDMRTYQAEEP